MSYEIALTIELLLLRLTLTVPLPPYGHTFILDLYMLFRLDLNQLPTPFGDYIGYYGNSVTIQDHRQAFDPA